MYQQSGKNLLNRNISTCPHNMCELLPSKGCVSLVTLGHRALQQILMGFTSWLHCFTDVARWRSTELCTMFGNLLVCLVSWCLWSVFSTNMAMSEMILDWYTIYIHFRGLLTLRQFCQVQNSLFVQVLHCPISAALLCGTQCVSQTLRHGTRKAAENGVPFFSTPILGRVPCPCSPMVKPRGRHVQ